MPFNLPAYHHPDFSRPPFIDSPVVTFQKVAKRGVAPENYHATSIHPEYVQVRKGEWRLLEDSRMDCVIVLDQTGALNVKEFRRLEPGDSVAIGRGENGEEGIFVHSEGFKATPSAEGEKFAFRTRVTRETSFSIDYDELYDLLSFERERGFIVWVMGPAVVFDKDAREAFTGIIEKGYVHGLLAGNALAVHDIEGSLFRTALGQEIYTKQPVHLGHYNHLDAINTIRNIGSLNKAIQEGIIENGVIHALHRHSIPHVLAGSIRDDGPLPEVITDACLAQERMRSITRQATTVIAMATQLHTIATGNMLPSYRVMETGEVRPVYFYVIDMNEFAADKLVNRGSLSARSILTNAQDFIVTLQRGLEQRSKSV